MSIQANIVREIEVSAFAHATEDEAKVERAMRNLLPRDTRHFRLIKQTLTGYYGDHIIIITLRIKKKTSTEILQNLIRNLSTIDQQRLRDEAEERLDRAGNLYIRLDKQKAYMGKVTLAETDPIRMKFRIQMPHGKDKVEYINSVVNILIDSDEVALIDEEARL